MSLLSSQMRDDAEFNISFISAVKKFPALYDATCEDYSNRSKIEKAWKKISIEMKYPVHELKKRWKNIRCAFLRSNRKLSKASVKRSYYLASHLDFLAPYLKPQKQTSNLDSLEMEDVNNSDTLVDDDNHSDVQELEEPNATVYPDNSECSHISDEDITFPDTTPQKKPMYCSKRKRDLAETAESSFTAKPAEDSFTAKSAKLTTPKDGLEDFCASLIPLIRSLPLQKQRQCRVKLLQAINELYDE